MEYVRGTDLKRLLADRGAVPASRALRWTGLAAQALAAAHEAGVIHRDLKPSNVIVTHDDLVKIVDFGIAKRRTDAGNDIITGRREVLGTAPYLSPEQVEHGIADERSDVWGLGCVLYELCVGAPPFGRAGNAATAAAILRDEPDLPASLPPAVRAVITACLRKSPFARVASPRELVALIRDAQAGGSASELPPALSSERLSEAPLYGSLSAHVASSMPSTENRASRASVRPDARPDARPDPRPSTRPPASTPPPAWVAPTARGRIKGTAIRAGLAWFLHSNGEVAYARVLEGASPDLRALLGGSGATHTVIASGWYDAMLVAELLERMELVAAPEDPEAYLAHLTTAIAKDNVTGIYRTLFKLITTPELLVQNAQRIFSTYFDEGSLTATVPRPGELLFVLRGLPQHHPRVCKTTCAALQAVLRAVGYQGAVLERTGCLADGAHACTFEGLYLTTP
jgi:hypothetical protein